MQQTNARKEIPSEVRVIVEVDGNPVGFLNLDIDRLWPLINHRKRDIVPVEWIDAAKFDSIMRAAVIKRLLARLQSHLYRSLGDEIVKAELDVETFNLKAEAAGKTFGRARADVEKLVGDSDSTTMDFYTFFWEYLLDERESIDLKKEWKVWRSSIR
jgi:hypothetical protein